MTHTFIKYYIMYHKNYVHHKVNLWHGYVLNISFILNGKNDPIEILQHAFCYGICTCIIDISYIYVTVETLIQGKNRSRSEFPLVEMLTPLSRSLHCDIYKTLWGWAMTDTFLLLLLLLLLTTTTYHYYYYIVRLLFNPQIYGTAHSSICTTQI